MNPEMLIEVAIGCLLIGFVIGHWLGKRSGRYLQATINQMSSDLGKLKARREVV